MIYTIIKLFAYTFLFSLAILGSYPLIQHVQALLESYISGTEPCCCEKDTDQEDPVLASDDPFGPYFDASLIWGPVFGRKIYAGLRFRIN